MRSPKSTDIRTLLQRTRNWPFNIFVSLNHSDAMKHSFPKNWQIMPVTAEWNSLGSQKAFMHHRALMWSQQSTRLYFSKLVHFSWTVQSWIWHTDPIDLQCHQIFLLWYLQNVHLLTTHTKAVARAGHWHSKQFHSTIPSIEYWGTNHKQIE